MQKRRYLFPHVIEMNYQARHRLGVNVYLIEDAGQFLLIDIGYEDAVDEIAEIIRTMDFSLSACKMLIATHADVDHAQGLARAKEIFKAPIACHADCADALREGDTERTFARIKAQDIDIPMPSITIDRLLQEGERIEVGNLSLEVWSTPGHAVGQLAFKLGNLLFVGDNIYKDGSVGVIDAHHGSSIPDFIASLERILADDSEFLLPSHGPVFRRDNAVIERTIARLNEYQYLADFGTCAVGWPLLKEWEQEVISGRLPEGSTGADPTGTVPETASPESHPGKTKGRGKSKLPGALS